MDIFHTALGLSKQENGFALTCYLAETLENEFQPKEIAVYEVFGVPGNYTKEHTLNLQSITIRRFDYADNTERQRSDVSQFIEAIKSGHPVFTQPDKDRTRHIAMPIPSRNGPLRLIVISNISESPEQRMQLFQIVELYSSMVGLHDSHERDQLTGLLNRTTFSHYYQRMAKTLEHQNTRMFLAIFDIDHFKRVNDTYGHLFGDEVLLQFAHLMENCFRYNDALFRFGGEEFIAMIKCAVPEHAQAVFNRFRSTIEQHDFPGVGKITVSIGFAGCSASQFPDSVIAKADTALYYAKDHGRNQVINYQDIEQDNQTEEGDIDLF